MKQIKKQHENFKKIICDEQVDKIQYKLDEKNMIISDCSFPINKIFQLKMTKQDNINQFCRIFKDWLQNQKTNSQQNPKTKIINDFYQAPLNLTKISPLLEDNYSISLKYMKQHQLSLTTPLNQKFSSKRTAKSNKKYKNYQINYHFHVYWEQFIPKNFDSTLSQFDQLRDTQIIGKACWDSIDIYKEKTREIIIISIIEKQNHKILCVGQQPKIMSYSLKTMNKSILKNQYQCTNKKYSSYEYQVIELVATLSVKKIILRPTLSYNFENCCIIVNQANSNSSKVIKGLHIQNKQIQIDWNDSLEINQINFYKDVTLKKGIPLLSDYLLKTAVVTLKAACRFPPKQFRTRFLSYNKNRLNKN